MAPTSSDISRGGASRADQSAAARLLRLAVKGEALARILESGARELLDASSADRSGVWLLNQGQTRELQGVVLEPGDGLIPERWLKLDPDSPALAGLMDSTVDEV